MAPDGRKLVYTYGFGVFTAASAACGLAPGLTALIAFRLVQAAGAAMLQANSVALVTTSVPKARMRLALGMQAGAQSLGLALGPTLGGLITVTVGWRFVYWFNVPVGIMTVVAARYLLPRTRDFGSPGRFDWPGCRIVDLKEELEQRAVADLRRIKGDFDRFSVISVVAIGRILDLAAGITDARGYHAGIAP